MGENPDITIFDKIVPDMTILLLIVSKVLIQDINNKDILIWSNQLLFNYILSVAPYDNMRVKGVCSQASSKPLFIHFWLCPF